MRPFPGAYINLLSVLSTGLWDRSRPCSRVSLAARSLDGLPLPEHPDDFTTSDSSLDAPVICREPPIHKARNRVGVAAGFAPFFGACGREATTQPTHDQAASDEGGKEEDQDLPPTTRCAMVPLGHSCTPCFFLFFSFFLGFNIASELISLGS